MRRRVPSAVRRSAALLWVYAATAALMGALACACWWRIGALAGSGMMIGLSSVPGEVSDQTDALLPDLTRVAEAQAGLDAFPLAGWFPLVDAVLGVVALGVLLTAAVLVSRMDPLDFGGPGRGEQDPRWADFVQRRAERGE
ncbi:hypothetical protein ACTOB_005932 [Actinoplanes oblitus]|uniref:Lipoprotein n=1 Tax=Actinoplanes oblitus TaxID=3040509 RepID=A0ABY8W8D9_9ACTN|nr:hypothetical protein [Actinoplanes oblitus]WIM93938.1 hypothetical protein ACTOB_005932 [Actinoplanes oblitus]